MAEKIYVYFLARKIVYFKRAVSKPWGLTREYFTVCLHAAKQRFFLSRTVLLRACFPLHLVR